MKHIRDWDWDLIGTFVFAVLVSIAFFTAPAFADVITCTTACDGHKPKSALLPADIVLWCESGGPLVPYGTGAPRVVDGKNLCPNEVGYRVDGLQLQSWTLTDTGWYRYAEVPETSAPPAYTYKPPACFSWDTVNWKWQGTAVYVVQFCEHPDGIRYTARVFDVSKGAAMKAPPTTTDQVLAADKLLVNRGLTAVEAANAQSYANEVKPTAKVVNSTLSTGQVVGPYKYKRNADGSLGSRLTRAAVDEACNIAYRIVTAGKTTDYYMLDDGNYAKCTVTGRYVKLK